MTNSQNRNKMVNMSRGNKNNKILLKSMQTSERRLDESVPRRGWGVRLKTSTFSVVSVVIHTKLAASVKYNCYNLDACTS